MRTANVFSARWRWTAAVIAAIGTAVPTAMAWACVAVVSFTANPSSVPPGGTAAVTGRDFAPGAVIEVHLDSPTGRLLATQPPFNQSVMQSTWTQNVTIPADVPAGQHFLVATQDYHNHNAGTPARATIWVGQPAQAAAPPAGRPTTVDVSSGPRTGALLMTGLGVAAAALLIAGLLYAVASRRPPRAAKAQPAGPSDRGS